MKNPVLLYLRAVLILFPILTSLQSSAQCDALFRKFHFNSQLQEVTDSNYDVVATNGDVYFKDSSFAFYDLEVYRFGDGDSAEMKNYPYRTATYHQYKTSGVYVAEREVWDSGGCHAHYLDTFNLLMVRAQAIQRIGGDGKIYFYNTSENFDTCWWKFSDGSVSTDVNPVLNSKGNLTFVNLYISFRGFSAHAYFKIRDKYDAGFTLTGSNSSDPNMRTFVPNDGSWPYERWTFGDGSPDYIYNNPSGYQEQFINRIDHSFPSSGKYTVTRYVADSAGGSIKHSASTVVDMDDKPCNPEFYAFQDELLSNTLRVEVHGKDESNHQYTWSINGEVKANKRETRIGVSTADSFQLCLRIKNNNLSCEQTYCDSVGLKWTEYASNSTYVETEEPIACKAEFEAFTRRTSSAVAEIELQNNSRSFHNSHWKISSTSGTSFVQGTNSGSEFPVISATNGDNLTVCLTVSFPRCADSLCKSLSVDTSTKCYAYYTVHQDTVPSLSLRLANHSSDSSTHQYQWKFDNRLGSFDRNPSRFMPQNKKYSVCLTITDTSLHCTDVFCDSMGLDSNGYLLKAQGFYIIVKEAEESSIGIESVVEVDFKVYPNPVDNILNVHVNRSFSQTLVLEIVDLNGRIVKSQAILNNEEFIDLTELQSGIYTLVVQSDEGINAVRFLKR